MSGNLTVFQEWLSKIIVYFTVCAVADLNLHKTDDTPSKGQIECTNGVVGSVTEGMFAWTFSTNGNLQDILNWRKASYLLSIDNLWKI